jgi:hypothetical protein
MARNTEGISLVVVHKKTAGLLLLPFPDLAFVSATFRKSVFQTVLSQNSRNQDTSRSASNNQVVLSCLDRSHQIRDEMVESNLFRSIFHHPYSSPYRSNISDPCAMILTPSYQKCEDHSSQHHRLFDDHKTSVSDPLSIVILCSSALNMCVGLSFGQNMNLIVTPIRFDYLIAS